MKKKMRKVLALLTAAAIGLSVVPMIDEVKEVSAAELIDTVDVQREISFNEGWKFFWK